MIGQGDALLNYLAQRMQEVFGVRRTLIGKLASNLFVMLLPLENGGEQAALKIRKIFRECPVDMEILPAVGLYTVEEMNLPVALMCDRVLLALNSVKGNYMQMWAVYDEPMRNRLMQQGFTVLMDDFGSGYSSLNLLKNISIDVLKLDMRFLDNYQRKSRDIVTSVVRMAKWLNLKVVTEGVENRRQVS